MLSRYTSGSTRPPVHLGALLGRGLLLALPAVLLLTIGLRSPATHPILWGALAALVAVAGWAWLTRQLDTESFGPVLILLYVIGLSGLVVAQPKCEEWLLHLSQAMLLVVPVWLFGVQCLHESGAMTLRRARSLAAGLAARRDWPADLMQIRHLPEVQALREALHVDASPALELLANSRTEVRLAALSALEFRPTWRPGQPQLVLQLAQRAPEPEVRSAAVNALANVEERMLVEAVGELMRDHSPLVRQTATEALLWDTESRWPWLRNAVRLALADPVCQEDGPLRLVGQPLAAEAVADLHVWAAEKGLTAMRAALTLGAHYGQMLATGATAAQIGELRKQLTTAATPPILRLELARLLHQHHELGEEDLQKLIDPGMPAPVRLIAVEALLGQSHCPEALAALHDLARLPNREIALLTADVVQRRLGIDLGLPRGQAAPAVHTRTAAEVARRVMLWAMQHEVSDQGTPRPAGSTYGDSHVNL